MKVLSMVRGKTQEIFDCTKKQAVGAWQNSELLQYTYLNVYLATKHAMTCEEIRNCNPSTEKERLKTTSITTVSD
jgi:hypothetical protein